MSIFKKALGAFVELEPDAQTNTPAVARPFISGANSAPAYDQDMVEALQRTVAARKTPYTALLETSARLEKVIADEPTRLKAAFATIAADGQRTLDNVVQAIDVHIADVEGERMRFKRTSEANFQSKVGTLQSKAQANRSAAEAAVNRIKQLQEEITTQQQRAAEATGVAIQAESESAAAQMEIENVTRRFDAAVDLMKSNLESRKHQLGSVLR